MYAAAASCGLLLRSGVVVNTWLLFFAYTFLPVALFWFLDRSNAIHDTSLFAAVLIGFGYRQILSGELTSIRPAGDISKFWQPFAAWADPECRSCQSCNPVACRPCGTNSPTIRSRPLRQAIDYLRE